MKEQLKDYLKKSLYYAGYYALYEFMNSPSEKRLLIFMLHDAADDQIQRTRWYKNETPSASHMEAILKALKKRFRIITVEDAIREIRESGALKEKSVAITFDDGYLSTYETVFPLLRKHNATATVFLPTDFINGRLNPWWMTLTSMIDTADLTAESIAEVGRIMEIAIELQTSILNDPFRAKQSLHARIEGDLMRMDDATRSGMLQAIRIALLGSREIVSHAEAPMSWAQIREMFTYGIKFGAHTCSHPNLSHVSLETAEREIVESKRVIESQLSAEIRGFAYPYGYDVDNYRRLRPIFENHGFDYACTSWWGHVDSKSDPYLLFRTGLPLSTSPAILSRALSLEYCIK